MSDRKMTSFDFYYGKEAEQFNFYRIPKMLFEDERFKRLSSEAKILYGLLLDRMSLSIKNGWFDDENRVYIYFTTKEVMENLNIAKEKCTKIFAELDSEKGCGLIIKVRQGLGKPDRIYVMNFMSCVSADECDDGAECQDAFVVYKDMENTSMHCLASGNSKIEKQEFRKSKIKKFENRTSGGSKIESQEFRKSKPNDNDINNININYTDYSDINPILSYQHTERLQKRNVMDEISERRENRQRIAENIDYEYLVQNYGKGSADDVLETMLDAICSKKDYLRLGEETIPQIIVKNRLLRLEYDHIEYALDSIKRNATNVRNPKQYLLVTLYNSLTSMDTYYTTIVNFDLCGAK